MKPIKIDGNKNQEILITLKNIQSKAKTRLCFVTDVYQLVRNTEATLNRLEIPKKYWTGTTATYAEKVNCNSYSKKRWEAPSTAIVIERKKSGWFLVSAQREDFKTRRGREDYDIFPSTSVLEYMAQNARKTVKNAMKTVVSNA